MQMKRRRAVSRRLWSGVTIALVAVVLLPACSASSGSGSTGGSGASAGSAAGASGGSGGTSSGGASGAAAGSRTVGEPCTSNEQCTDPPDAECYTTIGGGPVPSITFPGGYCSKPCDGNTDGECGTEGGCVQSSFSGGQGSVTLSICASGCATNAECREAEGYQCQLILPGFGFCAPP